MTLEKLAVNYAIMIERLRNGGLNNNEILRFLKEKDYTCFEKIGTGSPDWETLGDFYYTDTFSFEKILHEGYSVKFLTKGTLQTLLLLKFHLHENKDYESAEKSLRYVNISNEQLLELKAILSNNWVITEQLLESKLHIHIELKTNS